MPYLEENTPTVWAHVRDLLEKNKGKEPGQRPGKSQAYVFLKQYQQGLITMEALQKKNAAIAKFVQQRTDFAQGQQYERYLRDMRPEYSVADNRESQEDTEFCAALSALESYAYVPWAPKSILGRLTVNVFRMHALLLWLAIKLASNQIAGFST